jgi:hypothetical protein
LGVDANVGEARWLRLDDVLRAIGTREQLLVLPLPVHLTLVPEGAHPSPVCHLLGQRFGRTTGERVQMVYKM